MRKEWVVLQSVLDFRSHRAFIPGGEEGCRAARARSDLRPTGLSLFRVLLRCGFARRRLRFWPGMRGTMRSGTLAARLPRANACGLVQRFHSFSQVQAFGIAQRPQRCPRGRVCCAA